MGSFSSRRRSQKSLEMKVLFIQEHCIAAQKSVIDCSPSPPNFFGVKIIFFEYLLRLPFMNFIRIFSSSRTNSLGGCGSTAAMCVNLDMTQALIMFTLPVVDGFVEDLQ